MYKAILETDGLRNEEQKEVQQLGLEGALNIQDEKQRAEVLAAMAPLLTEE